MRGSCHGRCTTRWTTQGGSGPKKGSFVDRIGFRLQTEADNRMAAQEELLRNALMQDMGVTGAPARSQIAALASNRR